MKHHYYYFDLARVIAALLVLLVHARVEILTPYSLLPGESQTLITKLFYAICSLGTDAVIVFFVISGFLVGGRNLEMLIHGKGSAKEFAINRLCRIYPPLLVSLILCSLQKYITGEVIDYMNLLGNLFCLQGIAVTPEMPVLWTIAFEMFFYLFVFSSLLIRNQQTLHWGILSFGLSFIFAIKLRVYFWSPLFFGCLMFFVKDNIVKRKSVLYSAIVLGIIAAIGEKITCESSAVNVLSDVISHDTMIIIESVSCAYVLTYFATLKPDHQVLSAIESFGTRYAKFSYSLFLCHYPLLKLIHYFIGESLPINSSGITIMLIVCAICIAFSYLFYSLTEKHTKVIVKNVTNLLS